MENEILRILNDSYQEYKKDFDNLSALHVSTEDIRKGNWYLYKEYGKPIGCGSLNVQGTEFSISYISVLPKHRGKGIGTSIFRKLEERAFNLANIDTGFACIRNQIEQNIRFIEKLGFKLYMPYGEEHSIYIKTY